MRVLAIEDDAVYVSLMQAHVSRAGSVKIDLDCVTMLAQGMTKLAERPYDAVLLDLHLPDSRGPGTVTTVRNQYPSVPIVVLTSSDNEQTAAEVYENGAQEYLVKGKTTVASVVRSLKIAAERKIQDDRMRLFESALHNCAEGIIITDGRPAIGAFSPPVTFVSNAFLQATGLGPHEVLGKPVEVVWSRNPDQLVQIRESFEAQQSGAFPITVIRSDGLPWRAHLKMIPVPLMPGILSHWLMYFQAPKTSSDVQPGTAAGIASQEAMEMHQALMATEERLRLLNCGIQDQATMVQNLYKSNQEMMARVRELIDGGGR